MKGCEKGYFSPFLSVLLISPQGNRGTGGGKGQTRDRHSALGSPLHLYFCGWTPICPSTLAVGPRQDHVIFSLLFESRHWRCLGYKKYFCPVLCNIMKRRLLFQTSTSQGPDAPQSSLKELLPTNTDAPPHIALLLLLCLNATRAIWSVRKWLVVCIANLKKRPNRTK